MNEWMTSGMNKLMKEWDNKWIDLIKMKDEQRNEIEWQHLVEFEIIVRIEQKISGSKKDQRRSKRKRVLELEIMALTGLSKQSHITIFKTKAVFLRMRA